MSSKCQPPKLSFCFYPSPISLSPFLMSLWTHRYLCVLRLFFECSLAWSLSSICSGSVFKPPVFVHFFDPEMYYSRRNTRHILLKWSRHTYHRMLGLIFVFGWNLLSGKARGHDSESSAESHISFKMLVISLTVQN